MKKFVLAYYGQPDFNSAEEAKAHQVLWMKWAQELGDAIVEMGTPAMPGKTVNKAGVIDADPSVSFSGYTIVQADSLDTAVSYTQKCPFVVDGGTMSVHEASEMSM